MPCEYVSEYAKYLVYSKNYSVLQDQYKIFAEQKHRLEVLKNSGLRYVIVDSPLPTGILYGRINNTIDTHFENTVWHEFNKFNNINLFINRNVPFSTIGRLENADDSDQNSTILKDMLQLNSINYVDIETTTSLDKILTYI